jgi:hypothetical protein
MDRGGSLLLMLEPGSDALEGILTPMGLAKGEGPLANDKYRMRLASPHFLLTDRYGTHVVVKTVSQAGNRGIMVLNESVALVEDPASKDAGRTVLIRTYENTWADADRNAKKDAGEDEQSFQVAFAVEGPEKDGEEGYRAVVFGNVAMFSDAALTKGLNAGPVMLRDTLRWLGHDDEIVGDVANEEDVKIQHTKDGQGLWFLGVLFGMPVLVLLVGAGLGTLRRMRRS